MWSIRFIWYHSLTVPTRTLYELLLIPTIFLIYSPTIFKVINLSNWINWNLMSQLKIISKMIYTIETPQHWNTPPFYTLQIKIRDISNWTNYNYTNYNLTVLFKAILKPIFILETSWYRNVSTHIGFNIPGKKILHASEKTQGPMHEINTPIHPCLIVMAHKCYW